MNVSLDQLVQLAKDAGAKTLSFFGTDLTVRYKSDQSPLTQADLASHALIQAALEDWTPDIPVISEESALPDYAIRQTMDRFWIIDPLDGTKEFVKAIPEYTVNIALIEKAKPVMGVVGIPATGTVYGAQKGRGSFRWESDGSKNELAPLKAKKQTPHQFVTSRSHLGANELMLIEQLQAPEPIRAGSAVKFCLVAEGKADAYIRHLPIMEWDTAAGDLILREVGGCAKDWNGVDLGYNKPDVRHAGLMATANKAMADNLMALLDRLAIKAPF